MTELTATKCQPEVELKRANSLPRSVREKIIHQYLSGRKTYTMLATEYDIRPDTIRTMVRRFKQKNDAIFTQIVNQPVMSKKVSKEEKEKKKEREQGLIQENKQLRQQLHLMELKLEGYQIMSDILKVEYGIDLSKKSAARWSSVSKNDTQK
jgi:transposase-like protein